VRATCLERKRGTGGTCTYKPRPHAGHEPNAPAKMRALDQCERCACGLMRPCVDCPLAMGAIGYMATGSSNLGELFTGGRNSGGTGTHQGRRQKFDNE
jgi:hypothetical protein